MLHIFYHRYTAIVFRTVLFDTFCRLWKRLFFDENVFKVLLYLFLFYRKNSNFNDSEIVGPRKLSDPSMNKIFNILSIVLQYTFSFKRPDFGLKYLVTITPSSVLKIQGYWINERWIVAHFLNLLITIELLLWNRKERQNADGYVLFEPFRVSTGVELYHWLRVS